MTAAPQPEVIAAEGLAVRYPYAAQNALGPLDFRLEPGERVLLLGPSGCGKSTLLHALTGLLPRSIPAKRQGSLRLFGAPVESRLPAEWAAKVAILFQDAEQTLAGFTVADEIAFALENRAYPPHGMAAAVARAMAQAGLPGDWQGRRIGALSGGQKQLVALAATLAQGGDLLIADEPTASLAPGAARLLAEQLLSPGRSALIVDHRLGPLLERIDRVVVLGPDGQMLVQGCPESVFAEHGARLHAAGIWVPPAVRLRLALVARGHALPLFWRMAELLAHLPPGLDLAPLLLPAPLPSGKPVVALERAACAPPFGPVVLGDVSLALRTGEVLGILGPNGAGKSTLAAALAGLAPLRGGWRQGPPGAIAFQNPEAHFSTDSARAELAANGVAADRIESVLAEWGLAGQAGQHPFTLSMGQKRRLVLAMLTASDRWPLLILDEPTAGLDRRGTERVAGIIRRLAAAGRALAVITHDADFALSVCDRVALLKDGALQAEGPALTILRDQALLEGAGLAAPEATPLLERIEALAC